MSKKKHKQQNKTVYVRYRTPRQTQSSSCARVSFANNYCSLVRIGNTSSPRPTGPHLLSNIRIFRTYISSAISPTTVTGHFTHITHITFSPGSVRIVNTDIYCRSRVSYIGTIILTSIVHSNRVTVGGPYISISKLYSRRKYKGFLNVNRSLAIGDDAC